jgi:hypothetical protein
MRTHTTALTVAALCMSAVCGGCGTAPWQESAPNSTASPFRSGSAAPSVNTPSPSISSAPSNVATVASQNDLATGSAKRKLDAGGVRLSINYWSTLPMGDWTQSASKPLNMSASAKFIDGSEQNIFLSKVSVDVAVAGPDGPLEAPKPLIDEATIDPGYLIKSPSSYGQVFTIPSLPPKANSVTLAVTYELLAQTAPKAKTYAKQTASDTLTLPIQ